MLTLSYSVQAQRMPGQPPALPLKETGVPTAACPQVGSCCRDSGRIAHLGSLFPFSWETQEGIKGISRTTCQGIGVSWLQNIQSPSKLSVLQWGRDTSTYKRPPQCLVEAYSSSFSSQILRSQASRTPPALPIPRVQWYLVLRASFSPAGLEALAATCSGLN